MPGIIPLNTRRQAPTCPLKVGDRVTVRPSCKYASEWPGEYVVVSLVWRYLEPGSEIDIGIASDGEIYAGHGYTDGFSADDLEPAALSTIDQTMTDDELREAVRVARIRQLGRSNMHPLWEMILDAEAILAGKPVESILARPLVEQGLLIANKQPPR